MSSYLLNQIRKCGMYSCISVFHQETNIENTFHFRHLHSMCVNIHIYVCILETGKCMHTVEI